MKTRILIITFVLASIAGFTVWLSQGSCEAKLLMWAGRDVRSDSDVISADGEYCTVDPDWKPRESARQTSDVRYHPVQGQRVRDLLHAPDKSLPRSVVRSPLANSRP